MLFRVRCTVTFVDKEWRRPLFLVIPSHPLRLLGFLVGSVVSSPLRATFFGDQKTDSPGLFRRGAASFLGSPKVGDFAGGHQSFATRRNSSDSCTHREFFLFVGDQKADSSVSLLFTFRGHAAELSAGPGREEKKSGSEERASLVHVAGDLKAWPAMRRFLAAGRPGLEEEEGRAAASGAGVFLFFLACGGVFFCLCVCLLCGPLCLWLCASLPSSALWFCFFQFSARRPGSRAFRGLPSPSRQWWGGAARSRRLRERSQQQLFLMAKRPEEKEGRSRGWGVGGGVLHEVHGRAALP